MSEQDREKWDKKYLAKPQLLEPRAASFLVAEASKSVKELVVLDLACGAGRNAIHLAKAGHKVVAVDIASQALECLTALAQEQGVLEYISTFREDLDSYVPQKNGFDLVVMTNYLDRDLIKRSKEALKSGRIFVVETYMVDDNNEKKESNPVNLLAKEELKSIFAEGYDILFYETFENEPHEIYRMKKQAIMVKKQ